MIDLTKKENWTPELLHVHKTAGITGIILGVLLGADLLFIFLTLTNHIK
jgi:hypothetical protein